MGWVRWLNVATLSSLAVISICGTAEAAGALASRSLLSSPLLWATVDQCTSATTGNVVGVRGSMPGTGRRDEQMFMRFRLQYRRTSGVWHYLRGADSGFVAAGSSRYVSRQAGRDFDLAAGTSSGTVLRGVVIFDWRVGRTTLHHAQLRTSAGRQVSAGAIPPGYSAKHCTLS